MTPTRGTLVLCVVIVVFVFGCWRVDSNDPPVGNLDAEQWGPWISGVRMRVAIQDVVREDKRERLPVVYIENKSGGTIHFDRGGGIEQNLKYASLVHYASNMGWVETRRKSNGSMDRSEGVGQSEEGLKDKAVLRLEMQDKPFYDSLRSEHSKDGMIVITSFYTSDGRYWALWSNVLRVESNAEQPNRPRLR